MPFYRHYTICFIVTIITTPIYLLSQSFNSGYNFKHLNVQNGLTQNIVYHFLQDSRGYMWVGTHNGLNLYDGARTINFLHNEKEKNSIGGDFITSLLEDSSQRICVGNESGIDLYDPATDSFKHFGVDRPDGTNENTYCVALGFVHANDLWILETKTRSVRSLNIKTGHTSFIASINTSHAQLFKGSGGTVHLWSAYDKGTIHQVYRNSKLISEHTYFDGKHDLIKDPELEVTHILQQNDTTVWLSTNKGLVKLNPVQNKYILFNQWKNQTIKEVRNSTLVGTNQLWIATGTSGIYTFNISTNKFIENYRNDKLNPFSICSDNIVSLYFDKIGNFWCGSYGDGASYTNTGNNFFSSYVSKDDVQAWKGNNYIHWFGSDAAGNIWCTFDYIPGFLILDKSLQIKKFTIPIFEDGSVFNPSMYKLIFESPEEVWCTSNKGLYSYNPVTGKIRQIKYELLNDEVQGSIWIKDIIRLKDNSILFSTFWGLYRISKENGKNAINPVHFQKPGSYIGYGELYQDEAGLIYIKSLVDSLYIIKPLPGGKKYELIKESGFAPFLNQFYSEKNDSLLYLATSEGLYHINKKNLRLEKDDLSNKIPFLNISKIFKNNNNFWIFGERGLYTFRRKTNEERTFTIEDGLPANEFTLSGLVITADGKCIAGTSNGLVSFQYQQYPDSIHPARPQLISMYVNDTAYTTIVNPNETKKVILSHRENTFSFNFSPIAFQHIADYKFEYKLENYDKDWINSGNVNYTRYSKIPPGKYVFNLRVADARGVISPFTKTLEIQINKAFWQTNLFIIAVLSSILLMGWLVFKWYLNSKLKNQRLAFEKQQAIEKERTRIATDMHDDLGAGLSRIKFLSETIGIKKQQQQPIEDEIGKIRQYSHDMIDKMGEIVWALNEKNDSLSDLLSYTRVYAMEYLSQNGISCVVETPDQLPSGFVSGEFRRNVYLTVKEALHNIVKHSQATSVIIKIHVNDRLEFSLKDNGVGFDKNNIRPFSNGLTNMENRIKEINGKFLILNGKGTTIKIIVPIPV